MSPWGEDTAALTDQARGILDGTSAARVSRDHLEALLERLADAYAEVGAYRAELDGRDEDLAELRDEGCRLTQHIARLEAANTRLHQYLAEEQSEREALVVACGNAMGEMSEYFRQANRLRGRGTPRAEPHSLSLHERRYDVAGA